MTGFQSNPTTGYGPEYSNAVHAGSDVDVGPLSQHHTLGRGNTNSSPGNHSHNGVDSAYVNSSVLLSPGGTSALNLISVPGLSLAQWVPLPASRAPVRLVRDTNLSVATPGSPTIDGVAAVTGDSILLVGQTAGAENGIYLYNGSGSALTRRSDASVSALMPSGTSVACAEGTLYAGTDWKLFTLNPITLGTTALAWGLLSFKVMATQNTSSTTTSTTFANLADAVSTAVTVWMAPGQTVEIEVQARATLATGGAGHSGAGSYAVSGAETIAAASTDSWETLLVAASGSIHQGRASIFTAAVLGQHTFTMQYRIVGAGETLTATNRRISAAL